MNASTVSVLGRRRAATRPGVPGAGPVRGRRGLVLGGSLAGLLSARVMARHFDQVVIVERDQLSARPAGARRGVPQGRHSHGLLVGGSRALERLLPGLTADLIARGAIRVDAVNGIRYWVGGTEQAQFASSLEGLLASRPLIEDEVRRHVLGLPNVVLFGGYDIAGLVMSGDRRRVLGARVVSRAPDRGPGPEPDPGAAGPIPVDAEPIPDAAGLDHLVDGAVLADLVVDATGRGSRAATWLSQAGYPTVEETVVEVGGTYRTRRFRHRPGVLDGLHAEVIGTDPAGCRGGVALRQENETWTVTLTGMFGERPPGELAEFQAFARGLPTPGLAEITASCEPIDGPLTYHYPCSRWLHWEKLAERPERFTVIGDAVCSFNPVYGQGMSSTALQAQALADVLEAGLDGLPARAARSFARVVATPWALATGADRRHPSQPAKPLAERLLDRYLDRLLAVAPHDRDLTIAFAQVLNLLAAPTSLLTPRIAARVLRPGRRTATSATGTRAPQRPFAQR